MTILNCNDFKSAFVSDKQCLPFIVAFKFLEQVNYF